MNSIDYFALLDEPRRPALDADALKAKFLQFSGPLHPDRLHNAPAEEREAATRRYTELNAAYHCLREPKDRLLHLIELESGAKPKDVQRIPPDMAMIFGEMSRLCRDADVFLAQRAQATSPLVKAKLFAQGLEWTDKLQPFLAKLNSRRAELEAELLPLNAVWETAPEVRDSARVAALPLARLEELQRVFGYLARWTAQAQERLVQLAI